MNFIIGSGITGMLARHILGDKFKFITQKRSRYYSFDPVLADNYIVRHEDIDEVVKSIIPTAMHGLREYKRAFSVSGQLMYQENELTTRPYLNKVYGNDVPNSAEKHLQTIFWVYNSTVKQLHDKLQSQLGKEIVESKSEVVSIDTENKTVSIAIDDVETKKFDYDIIINTAPLDVLCNWAGMSLDLKAKNVCYYHIRTDKIDLEGADESLVCDLAIEFFKVNPASEKVKIGFNEQKKIVDWIFCAFDRIDTPHNYFGAILGWNLDIIDASMISNAIPLGTPPDLSSLEDRGVYCVGSNAQWDDFMDVSSCINRLAKLRSKTSI